MSMLKQVIKSVGEAMSDDQMEKYEEEITKLQTELVKLNKERRVYKEEHMQNKKLKAQVEKQKSEVAKLEETVKEMQSTNDFLTKQINNLNDHIYELSNKENEDASENPATPLSRKSLARKSLGNKRLMEIQNESATNFNSPDKAKPLSSTNSNQMNQESSDTAAMTPSSARRLNQCAQQ
jgi:septal ring factor EnvC (AmiA/AmiB activator)